MAVNNQLSKGFANFKGLDLRSSDLQRSSEFASEIRNVDFRKTGAMVKRKGYQAKTSALGGFGLHTYNDIDTVTGKITEKLISIDETLHYLTKSTITVSYSGAGTAYCEMFLDADTGHFFFDIYEDNVRVLNKNLGTGIEEAFPVLLSFLITDINALTDFSASAAGIDTEPACFRKTFRNLELAPSNTIEYEYWITASLPANAPTPFSGAQANITDDEFENASFASLNNVMYIATGYDSLYKFDGTRLYKAGLPQPAAVTSTNLIAGSITDTDVQYAYTYEYTDAKGNIIESILSDKTALISPSSNDVEVTVSNILDTTGFDTDSTDLKINLYRTTASGTTLYLVKTVINDGTSATQVIVDDVTSAAILSNVEYIDPIKPHGLPPVVKYLTTYQGLLVAAGDPTNVNTVYYSDIDSPEYFPPAQNSFLVDTSLGDKVTGIAPLGNSLFVFKNRSISQVTGTIADDIFRVDLFGNSSIGCAAYHTIKEVNGNLAFLSNTGIFALNQNEQSLKDISEIIEPEFSALRNNFVFKKAVAIHDLDEDKYMIYMPVLDSNNQGTSASKVYAYDFFRDAWLVWTNINALGGLALLNEDLYFTERRYSLVAVGLAHATYKRLNTGTTYDYADHATAIDFFYKSHWETFGEPSVFKKWLRCKIHSLDASLDDFESEAFTLALTTELDYVNNVPSTQLIFDFSGSQNGGWGLDPWGLFSWGATRLSSKLSKLRAAKAKSLRLILKNNNLLENVLISGYEFEVAAPYGAFIKE